MICPHCERFSALTICHHCGRSTDDSGPAGSNPSGWQPALLPRLRDITLEQSPSSGALRVRFTLVGPYATPFPGSEIAAVRVTALWRSPAQAVRAGDIPRPDTVAVIAGTGSLGEDDVTPWVAYPSLTRVAQAFALVACVALGPLSRALPGYLTGAHQ